MTTPDVYYLNEISLPRFVRDCLVSRRPYLLIVHALFPPLQRLLEKIANWAIRSGRAEFAVKLVPKMGAYWDYDRRCLLDDVFGKYEDWQDSYFGLNDGDRAEPVYGYGYRLLAANFAFTRVMPAYLLDALGRTFPSARIYGVPPEALALSQQIFGTTSTKAVAAVSVPVGLINAISTLSILVYALGWVLSRTRFKVTTEKIFFAADYLSGKQDFMLYDEIADGGPVLMVMRLRNAPLDQEAHRYRQCSPLAGAFTPTESVEALRMLITDTIRLWFRHGGRATALYWRVAAMPYKRMIYRALFNRFRPDFFWGRDDYNVEHILRRAELNRVGGKSIGISHAVVTNFCPRFPQWRYIDFDIYYTFSIAMCDPYRDRWPSHMKLRSVGTYGLSREKLRQLPWPCGQDILIATRVAWNEPEMVRIVHAVAEAFPGYRILVQFKVGYLSEGTLEATLAAAVARFKGDFANIEHVTDNIFDLLTRSKYLVSDVSTLISEAIQLGIPTIFADVVTGHAWSIFRRFPNLSHTSAEEVVARLKAWDDRRETFARDQYMAFMGLSDNHLIYDTIRQDLGLPRVTDSGNRSA